MHNGLNIYVVQINNFLINKQILKKDEKNIFFVAIAAVVLLSCNSNENEMVEQNAQVMKKAAEKPEVSEADFPYKPITMLQVDQSNMITFEDLLSVQMQVSEIQTTLERNGYPNLNELYYGISSFDDLAFVMQQLEENGFSEEHLRSFLSPVLQKAERMHHDIVIQLKNIAATGMFADEEMLEFENLEEDLSEFENFSDMQKVKYGIALSSLPLGFVMEDFEIKMNIKITGAQALHCFGAAIGLSSIPKSVGLIFGSGLMAAKTLLQLAKALASRYVFGYFALAYSIYEFAMCINAIAGIQDIVDYNPNDFMETFDQLDEQYKYSIIFQGNKYNVVSQDEYCFLSVVNN